MDFRGSFEEYRAYKAARRTETKTIEAKKEKKPKEKKRSGSPEKLLAKVEREIAALEGQMAELEKAAAEFATDYEKLMEIEEKKAETASALEEKYYEWETLGEEIER